MGVQGVSVLRLHRTGGVRGDGEDTVKHTGSEHAQERTR